MAKPKTCDDAFKLLATQDAEALLLLLGELQPGEKAEITPLERELRISTRLPDQPYCVTSARGERIVHVEAESWWKNVMPKRMADYGAREWMKYKLPVECFVLLLTDRGLPHKPRTTARINAGDVQITVQFRIVQVSQISARQMLRLRREYLLPFVPLMKRTRQDKETSARLITEIEDEEQRNELSLYFSVFSGVTYNGGDLLDLVGKNRMAVMELMKESWVYQDIVKKGRDEGRVEGQQEILQDTLRQHIARRFPNAKVARKVAQLHDIAVLQQLCLEFSEIQDMVALRKRLDEAIQSQNR
jgi:predicted transposase YdaD